MSNGQNYNYTKYKTQTGTHKAILFFHFQCVVVLKGAHYLLGILKNFLSRRLVVIRFARGQCCYLIRYLVLQIGFVAILLFFTVLPQTSTQKKNLAAWRWCL
jgi:hypothetical protein